LCDPPFILEDTTAATGYYSSRTLNDFYYQQHIEALEQLYGKQNGRVKIYAYYLDSDGKYVKKIDVKGRKRNGQFHKKWKVYVPRELLEDRYFKKDFPKGYRLQYYNEGKPIPERKRWFQFNKKKTTIPKSYSQSGSRVKDLASHC
jgi:hypothetical protein